MYDIYGLVAVHLQPTKKMSWDELAAFYDRPSLLARALQTLSRLDRLGARFRRAKERSDPRDRWERAATRRVPA